MRLAVHVAHMEETRNAYKIWVRELEKKRSLQNSACTLKTNGQLDTIIVFLNIIHRPVLFKKHNSSETGLCLCLHVEPTQLGSIDRSSPCLQTSRPNSYSYSLSLDLWRWELVLWIGPSWVGFTWRCRQHPLSKTLCVLNEDKRLDNVQKHNNCVKLLVKWI
jgi:hypothetical protein